MIFRLFLCFCVMMMLASCGADQKSLAVRDFNLFGNFQTPPDSIIRLPLDLDSAVLKGIVIPTAKQVSGGYFSFSFRVKNTSDKLQRFFYKIFYQNETYKFGEDQAYAEENFYGSWENTRYTFKPTKTLAPGEETEVKDSFRIVGNPRNERKYYGANSLEAPVTQAAIEQAVAHIKSTPEWAREIATKAAGNKISVEEQFYMDALWALNHQRESDTSCNNRWKRNPRVGQYEFALVVSGQDDLDAYATSFTDISARREDGTFQNPFSYIRAHALHRWPNSCVIKSPKKLVVSARIDLSKGVYINPLSVNKMNFTRSYFNADCNDSSTKYSAAQMELFFHTINRDYVLHNVAEIRDVVGGNFTRAEYEKMVTAYAKTGKLIDTYVNSTDCPCRHVKVDNKEASITLENPGNEEGEYKKEHAGVISRIGFTYGKFRAKIKFPEILSRDHVWNGITNAFWLMAQDVNGGWNTRRACDAGIGYIPKAEADEKASLRKSKKQTTYSEIDFEILKESQFWPESSYSHSSEPYQTDDCANNNDVMVTCTNWDMACHEPEYYNTGAMAHTVDGVKYVHNRWNEWYKALTTKVPAGHNELFKAPYYYFEIEWTPEKITWRIGPEKDKLRTICVMNKNITSIPNNQMLMVITQEWHNQEWWPTAPYKQNFIPFPKNNIVGKILEIEVE